MPRFLASLAVVAALAIAVLAAACASQGDPNDATPVDTEHVIDPECLITIGTEFPAQHPDPASPERISELTRILCGEQAVQALMAGRDVGRDLWVRISYVYEYREANNSGEFPIAMVNFYFDPPVSYSGEAPFQTDPCSGHYGDDERLDPGDPCMDAPREYGRRQQEFADETGVVAEVDFRRGEVVELFAVPVAPEEMADIRSQFGGAAYVSIGDPVQTLDRAHLAGELFRQHLSERLNRPVDWVVFPGGTIDEFIDGSGGGTSHLDRVASDLAEWRSKGRPVVAITLGIGGDDLVEVGTRCHALGKQSCPDIYGEALTNYVEQLSLILRRLNEAKDPNTPLLLLTYYNASDCAQGGVELSPEELGVQGWNQAIIAAARANGAYLADIYTPFKGHGCEYTSGLRPNEKGHAAIAEVYEDVYESLPSKFIEPFALPAAEATAEAATPTPPAEASPTTPVATATPTLADRPGMCPEPYRRAVAVPSMLGAPMEGGASFQQGYLTLHLPVGRDFLVSSGVDGEGLVLGVYDVSSQSVLYVRGDGCEIGRSIGDPAGDAVFDDILATLEVRDSYVCPSPQRSVLAPDEMSEPGGERVTGGSLEAAKFGLDLPAGREFIVWVGVSDPGGGFTGVYDVVTKSWLFLGGDGCETSRRIADPAADAVFDQITAAIAVPVP
jgi:hypothetical protein